MLFTVICWVLMIKVVVSDPQANLLSAGCSQYKVGNVSEFRKNLNAMLSEIGSKLNNNTYFATAEQARGAQPVFTMVQCRKYLSKEDCVACFTVAANQIRNCSAGVNGARVIYDGCILRYESATFYDQSNQDGHYGVCGNQNESSAYQASVESLLSDLQIATPKIDGFFSVSKKEVVGGNSIVYGVAQCVETISKSGCQDCLTSSYADVQKCFPNSNSSSANVGCFLRYSGIAFFTDNQTIDLKPFLEKYGSSSKKKVLIAGVVGGIALLLLAVALFLWFKLSRKQKACPKDDILGATELRGPVSYSYKDLKSATKNFSEEFKLREGGFGEVYKVKQREVVGFEGILKNGKTVAVKKLAISQSHRAKTDFEKEVKIISNVHHRHLIRLLGCTAKDQN